MSALCLPPQASLSTLCRMPLQPRSLSVSLCVCVQVCKCSNVCFLMIERCIRDPSPPAYVFHSLSFSHSTKCHHSRKKGHSGLKVIWLNELKLQLQKCCLQLMNLLAYIRNRRGKYPYCNLFNGLVLLLFTDSLTILFTHSCSSCIVHIQ